MNRREFSQHLLTGLGGAALASSGVARALGAVEGPATSGATRRPNIVFVLSDQHSYRYTGFMGHPVVRTPNLDRIAQQGVVFQNTYCNSPVCSPSRAGLMTGMYPSDSNSFCNATVYDGSQPAWGKLMRDAGYHCYATGKMDSNPNFDLGFVEEQVGHGHVKNPDVTAFWRRPLCARPQERAGVKGASRKQPNAGDKGKFDNLLKFIRQQRGSEKPWVGYCGAHMPHPAFRGLETYFNEYLPRGGLPDVSAQHLDDLHFVMQELRHYKRIAQPLPEDRIRAARAAYFAMITEVDDYIGEVWRALEETGQLAHTIFVYTSDHGESLGEHGLWLKNNLYDVAARVPMVIAGAGVPRGRVVSTPVSHVDLIRTFLDVGGAEQPAKLRGHSLLPLLRGERGDHPGWAYCENNTEGNCTGSYMIRKGDWKYIHFTWFDDLLFNLADDPGEFTNRIGDPAAKSIRDELQAILRSQVDPLEVTLRSFTVQQKRMDEFAAKWTKDQMLDACRKRLGEGQAVALLTKYYGGPFKYQHRDVNEEESVD
jgi:choline-sulfatase